MADDDDIMDESIDDIMDESIDESIRADEVRQSLIIEEADMSDDDEGVRYSDDNVQSIEDDIIELSIIEEELSIIDDELLWAKPGTTADAMAPAARKVAINASCFFMNGLREETTSAISFRRGASF